MRFGREVTVGSCHGREPVTIAYRHFVTQSQSNRGLQSFAVPHCFHARNPSERWASALQAEGYKNAVAG